MKKVIIVDDEQDARNLLKEYISFHSDLLIIGEATNGIEAVELINRLKPDTLFLDIQMPGLNGFEVLSRLEEIPDIIFSSAYDQYAIKAFEVHAIDYLLKPYGKKRFDDSLSRIIKNQEPLNSLTEEILNKESTFPTRIILHKGSRKIAVDVNTIIYTEAYGDYSKVFTEKGELLSTKGISSLFEILNYDTFIKLHRSYFINKYKLLEIKKIERYYYAILTNGTRIRISESYLPEIKKLIV